MTGHKIAVTVICGPTGSGKTAAAIALAQRIGGEIVSADSMQIYRGLSVGTAKPTAEEQAAVPHHLIDICGPEQRYSVADYVADASAAIDDIAARGRCPIVAGGTGLYISALVGGLTFSGPAADEAVRRRLYEQYQSEGIEPLLERLRQLDPAAAAKLHPNNVKRVIRALELCEGGVTPSEQEACSRPAERPYRDSVFLLEPSDRAWLYRAIEARVDRMMAGGLLAEAHTVFENRARFQTAAQAIGYKEFFPYFEGRASVGDCVAELKKQTRRYAKRQLSWFHAMPGCRPLPVDLLSAEELLTALCS